MIGNIYINRPIGSYTDEAGVKVEGIELTDVIAQVQAQQEAERFIVHIDSPGGRCDTGWKIANYLRSLKQPVDTLAYNMCASMATIILMVGQNRIGIQGLRLQPHNPWTGGIGGDADDIQMAANEMRDEEDRMIAEYSKATGISKEGIDAIMKEDKPMTAEKGLELKFLTEVRPAAKAVAVLNIDKKTMEKTAFKKAQDILKTAMAALGIAVQDIKGLLVSDDKGTALEIWNPEDNSPATEIAPGKVVTIDGAAAPDGSYKIADQKLTFNTLLGVIESVVPDAAAATDPGTASAELIKTKDAEIEKLKADNKALTEANAVLAGKTEVIEKAIKALGSKHVPVGGQTIFKKPSEIFAESKIGNLDEGRKKLEEKRAELKKK